MSVKLRLKGVRWITQHAGVAELLLVGRLAGVMVRVFEVRGTCFPDASSNPGNCRGDQIQNRAKHENFEGAVPLT